MTSNGKNAELKSKQKVKVTVLIFSVLSSKSTAPDAAVQIKSKQTTFINLIAISG